MSKKVVKIVGKFCVKDSRIGVRRQLQYRKRQDVEIRFCIIDEGLEPGKREGNPEWIEVAFLSALFF